MKTYFDCIPCFMRQSLEAARLTTDDEQRHEEIIREVLGLAISLDLRQSPPAMGQKIHRIIRKLTGNDDPYLQIKNQSNLLALKLYPQLSENIKNSNEPFNTAVHLAVAGNIIDFGVHSKMTKEKIDETIRRALQAPLDRNSLDEFKNSVKEADDILYLGDNAGEIVFDRLLIEQLPFEKVTFVVKGGPAINDATMEDAEITGMTDIVEVIDNGSDAPGTILEDCSRDFRKRFEKADLVIAKGQGNYETLSDTERDIFFILKAKCPVIARHLDCEIGTFILKHKEVQVCNE